MESHTVRRGCLWLFGLLALLLPLLVACGGTRGGNAPTATVAPSGGQSTAGPTTGGAIHTEPVPGNELGGENRLGTPGLGAFLFFDAAG